MRRVGRSQHLYWLNDELRSSCSSSVFLLRFRSKYNPAWHALLSSSLKMASFLHFVAVDPARLRPSGMTALLQDPGI